MVNLQKSGDSAVKIVFTDSDHYLYGNGEVEVPVNSLLLVIDESEMVTFKKLSGDPFLSFRADNSNLGTKAAIEQFYKDNMVGSTGGGGTGSGVTSGDVETMIDESISGKADTSAVTAIANDVQTVSGQVQTKVATSDFNTYTAATATVLDGKQDISKLPNSIYSNASSYGSNRYLSFIKMDKRTGTASTDLLSFARINDKGLVGSNDVFSLVETSAITTSITSGSTDDEIPTAKATYDAIQAGGGGGANVIELTQAQYEALSTIDPDAIYVITDATAYDPSTKVDTSAITSSITSSSTNSEVAGAKAVYDAIQAGGGGGGATYSAGTNISIDTGNTINCTLPMIVLNNTNIDGGAQNSNMSNAYSSISYGKGNNFSRPLSYGAAFGQYNTISNLAECSVGYASKSNYNSSTFGDSGNTLFTVGNGGEGEQVRHNAFEVRQNGDIYFPNTDDTTYQNFNRKPMVRLQDMYAALGGLKFVKLSQSEYDNLPTKDANTLYIISNVVS